MIPQFIGAVIAAGVLVVGSSFVWPRLMGRERPVLLEDVHTKALETSLGQQVESVLGDTDSKEPIDVASASGQIFTTINEEAQKKAQEFINDRITDELVRRIELLSEDQKERAKDMICVPKETEIQE